MKKKIIVKSKITFNDIIAKGKRITNKYYVVCYIEAAEEISKFGIAVGKKVGNAVTRNKIKRQIRNIIDNNINYIQKYHNYIIICKKEILNLSFKGREHYLIDVLNKGEKYEK